MQKRMLAGAVTTVLLALGAAVPAAADPGNSPPGPGGCLGPPGQSGLVQFAKLIGVPPGQIVSECNGHGHGQNQGGGGGTI